MHIEVRFHHVSDMVNRSEVFLRYLESGYEMSDILTKPLGKSVFLPIGYRLEKESLIQRAL